MLRLFAILLTGILITSCQNTPPAKFPPPSFAVLPKLNLNVATIDVVDEYKPTFKSPNVEHLFPYPPADTFKIWVNDRLHQAGTDNRIVVTIKNASVLESPLDRTKGFKGAFTNDQVARYDAKIEVEMKLYRGQEIVSAADVSAQANRSRTIKEDATPQERDELFYLINKELMENLNSELEKNIRTYFAEFLQ